MKQTQKAILYCRVSTEEQAENGTSLETQKEACLLKAERMGAFPVRICEDEGVSGTRYQTRPGIIEALRLRWKGSMSS